MTFKRGFWGLAIAGICLYFAFRGVRFDDLWQAIRHAKPAWVLLGLASYLSAYLLRSARWRVLLEGISPAPVARLFRLLVIGFFANNLLPFRMGELVRAHIAGVQLAISRSASLGSIFLERLLDSLSLIGIVFVVMPFLPFPETVKRTAVGVGGGCALIVFALIKAPAYLRTLERFLERFAQKVGVPDPWRKKLAGFLRNFVDGTEAIRKAKRFWLAVLLSLGVWMAEATTIGLIARAFAIEIGLHEAFLLLFFLGLSVSIPQGPGYIGTIELFGVSALALLGYKKEKALPFMLSLHGIQFLFIMTAGLWALGKERITVQKLFSRAS